MWLKSWNQFCPETIVCFFELYPNEAHDVFTLAAIGRAQTERALRYVRSGGLNIVWDAKAGTYTNVT